MKKLQVLTFLGLILAWGLPAWANPSGSAASIAPIADFNLQADGYKGKRGIRMNVTTVTINGVTAGESIRFCAFVGNSEKWFPGVMACFDSKIETDPAVYPSLWFEFPNEEIEKQTGKGEHNLFVGLGAYTLDNLDNAFLWQTAPITVKFGEQKVSEGTAKGTVNVKVTDKTVEVEAVTEYKGPNRRIDAYLTILKGTNPALSDMPYTFEFRQGGNVKTGTAKWSIDKEKLSEGDYTADVYYKGTGGSNLGNANGANFKIEEEEEEEEEEGYTYDGPLIKIHIPGAKDYKDGLKGGVGTITFKGIESVPFKCDMYVTRKWVGGKDQYSNEAVSVRAAPNCANGLTQFSNMLFVDGISNFTIENANSSNSVKFEIIWGKLRADFNNCPVMMRGPGKFSISIEKGYVTAMTPNGYHNKVPGFTVRNYPFPDAHLEVYKDSAKMSIDTVSGEGKNAPISYISWKGTPGKFSLDSVTPYNKLQEVKNSGCR